MNIDSSDNDILKQVELFQKQINNKKQALSTSPITYIISADPVTNTNNNNSKDINSKDINSKDINTTVGNNIYFETKLYPNTNIISNNTYESDSNKTKAIYRQKGDNIYIDKKLGNFIVNYTLFIGNLGNDVTEENIRTYFRQYYSFIPNSATIVRDKLSGKTKGFGFVSFELESDYIAAYREITNKIVYIGTRRISAKPGNVNNKNKIAEESKRARKLLLARKNKK